MSVDSMSKILEYVSKVAKQPIFVDGERYPTPVVEKVVLQESFFYKDDCMMCGKCCPNETTVFTAEGWGRIHSATKEDFLKWGLDPIAREELLMRCTPQVIDINGSSIVYWVSDKDHGKDANKLSWEDRAERERCHWLFEKERTHRCRIHPIRSVTCGMPHCRMFLNKNTRTSTIGLSQFGRNWALKCPVVFGDVDEESTLSRIHWLNILNNVSQDLGIDTFLPEILMYLDNGERKSHVFERPVKRLVSVR